MTEAWNPELQKLGQKERDKLAEQARKQAEAEAAAEADTSKGE
jgi:hypothetical protein